MTTKSQRQDAIRTILREEQISGQDSLLVRLKKEGIACTQATLSRDLRELKVVKVRKNDGTFDYKLSEEQSGDSAKEISRVNFLADGFLSVDFSANLCVIKTLPGYASSIAAVIDNASLNEILGTIAGDDTILIIAKEGAGRGEVIDSLILTMPKLEEKLKEKY